MPRVLSDLLMDGLANSYDRLVSAANENDAFIAAFETLNWTVSIDDLFQTTTGHGIKWLDKAASVQNASGNTALWGLRYVRNSVHHHWGDALEWTNLPGFNLPPGSTMNNWVWRKDIPRPRTPRGRNAPLGEAEYLNVLVGQPATSSIEHVAAIFAIHHKLIGAKRPEYLLDSIAEQGFAESH